MSTQRGSQREPADAVERVSVRDAPREEPEVNPTERAGGGFASLVPLIQKLVSFQRWRFGQIGARSVGDFSCPSDADADVELKRFVACYKRQQRRLDPRETAVMQDPSGLYAITIMITLSSGQESMLMLLRDESIGPFSEHDLVLLSLVKELLEEWLPAQNALNDAKEIRSAVMRRTSPLIYIVDQSYSIVLGYPSRFGDGQETAGHSRAFVTRLPLVIEEAVRSMTAEWANNPQINVDASCMPFPALSVRVQSTHSAVQPFLAVIIERTRRRNVLLHAAKRFLVTPREREVVGYLLDGMRIEEIADTLNISISTVNDHVKKLLERTGSTNRSQMLARILGWHTPGTSATVERTVRINRHR